MHETLRIMVHMGGLQRLVPFWLAGILAMALWWTPWLLAAVAYGILLQFFVEYLMHRFVFHREPPADQGPFNELYRSHIGHHEFPWNPEFLTGGDHWFPARTALLSTVLHTLILWPFLGFWAALQFSWVALFVGSVSAFTFYEYCHTLAHLNVPKGWFGQRVTHEHLRHHFNDHDSNFHVTIGMGWIDRLFGTSYDRDTAKERFDRATILSMGMDPEDARLVIARKTYGLPARPSAKSEA